jgi:hypothetical protein
MTRVALFVVMLSLINTDAVWSQGFAYPVNKHFRWRNVETILSKVRIEQFIKSCPNDFGYFRQHEHDLDRANPDTLATRLHFLDINGDGNLDVIFSGESGGEANLILVYMNVGGKYKQVFSGEQYVDSLEWRDNRLYKIYIDDPGCCAEYLVFKKIYQVSYDKANTPAFVQLHQSEYVKGTDFPDSLWANPVRFEVLNDGYKLRFRPTVDDSSRQEWCDEPPYTGNLIGKLSKGARGTAFARKTDATGREWWYVEMDEEFYPAGQALRKTENIEFPTKAAGWLSSRFVKVIL